MIVVRTDVPVQPFSDGVLAGALSPRQVAEKAKANPKGAAPLFERGAIADWYENNGWIYPVQGPASSGLGAIQQFFEALGLVKPPVVEIEETAVHLHGAPGAALEHVLQVRARANRPVFAYATTGAPWLQIGRVLLDGRTAHIPLKVPNVPVRPGEQLQGKVQVTANGGQRFLVDVALHVDPPIVFGWDPVMSAAPVLTAADVASETETVADVVPVVAQVAPAVHHGRDELPPALPSAEIKSRERTPSVGKHLLPLGVLALLLLSVVAHDLWVIVGQPAGDSGAIDPHPYVFVHFHDQGDDKLPLPTMRFGLLAKDAGNPARLKKLTFDEHGRSNNTVLRVDGRQFLFGELPGEWIDMKSKLPGEMAGRPRDGFASSWRLPGGQLKVTQEVEIVPGSQSRRLDTCLVRYILENQDNRAHQVGIRFMLDTYIGANDGVPFTIPGASGLCDSKMMFNAPSMVPDFIQALENDDLRDPGTVAYLQFRIGTNVESPARVELGGWPNPELRKIGVWGARAQLTGWDVPFISMRESAGNVEEKDSAVTMYWNEQMLASGQSRVVGFTYGLGNVDARESGGHLLLTVGGRLVRRGEFTLTALVHQPQVGERLTLHLPPGFTILEGGVEQMVPPLPPGASRPDSPVTWRLRAGEDGKHELAVRSNLGATQKLPLTIRTRGVFD